MLPNSLKEPLDEFVKKQQDLIFDNNINQKMNEIHYN